MYNSKKFTIILPVRNGGAYVEKCIQSILSQTISDFELIILENASTDNTLQCIQAFNDSRIKVQQSNQDLSIDQNWARALHISKGEFVTIIGHDDFFEPDYLEVMTKLIEDNSQCSLFQSHFSFVDAEDGFIRNCHPMKTHYTASESIATFMQGGIDLMGTGFMMRSKDYDAVGGIPPYPNLLFADMELFISLAIKGGMAVSPKKCFNYRIHKSATTSSSSNLAYNNGFNRLAQYLISLKKTNPEYAPVIEEQATAFMHKYGQTITHKILKTKKSQRQSLSFKGTIDQLNRTGTNLLGQPYNLNDNPKIKLAQTIDNNVVLHNLYLLFRRFYKKPVFTS